MPSDGHDPSDDMQHKTLKDRIEVLREEGFTNAQLAKIAKVSSGAVAQWFSGATHSLKGEVALALQEGTGFNAKWLMTGKGPQKLQQAFPPLAGFTDINPASTSEGGGLPPAAPTRSRVAVMWAAKVLAGGDVELISIAEGGGFVWGFGLSDQAYAMKVRGDELHPVVRDGQILLMDPRRPAQAGDFVFIRLDSGETLLKELLFQREGSVTVSGLLRHERQTFPNDDVEFVHLVVAQLAPSMLER
jgi:hypothetical protein